MKDGEIINIIKIKKVIRKKVEKQSNVYKTNYQNVKIHSTKINILSFN